MQRCDVLIVGGGPAGSSCAWELRNSGLDVLVLDRQEFPRDKVCAGWITPQVIEALQLDLRDFDRERVCQPITGFRTGLIGGREIETRYDHAVSYGIRRREFDAYLLDRCGARRAEPQSVDQIEEAADGWRINGSIQARLLVGAGGHFCPIARRLGARSREGALTVAAQEIEYLADPTDLAAGSVSPLMPELFFCDDLQGYGWCFQKGGYLNIGLGRTDRAQLSSHVAQFVEFLRSRGKVAGQVPDRFHGHAYQLYERVQPVLCDDRVLLVGDAAGLAYPQSGEGIRPAVESGLLAARTIVQAGGRYDRERLEPYIGQLAARLGTPRAHSPSDWLPASWLRGLAGRLMSSRQFSRRVVLENWFLHMHQSALATR